jgi:hypothetical protein
MEGFNGFIIAADVGGIGHYTTYPSDKETVALQAPFKDGIAPAHTVLKRGPCHSIAQGTVHDNVVETAEKLLLYR